MSRKILIIYEKMGMGHLRMATILEEMLKGDDIEIVKYAGSELQGTNDIYTIVRLWNYLIKKNLIKTCDILLNFILRIFILPFIEVNQTVTFMNKIEEIKPDIIISTADGFNKVLGTYAAEKGIPFYIFITEISTFADLVNANATHICYFDETTEAIRSYDFDTAYFSYRLNRETDFSSKVKYIVKSYDDLVIHASKNSIFRNPNEPLERLNNARCEVIGPLAERKHFNVKNPDEMKKKLGIPSDRDTAIIVSGSIGGKFMLEMVKTICRSCSRPLNLLVMCGRDKDIYDKILQYNNTNRNVNIMPFEYINNFDEYMSAADCLIARPSAGIFIESLLNNAPMITFDTVTSNDKGSLTMIEKYKIGEICSEDKEVVPALLRLLENKVQYKNNIEMLLDSYYRTYEEKKAALRGIVLDGKHAVKAQDNIDIHDIEDEGLDVEVNYFNN